ncbi:MAG: HAD family hydrolase [Bacteroidales bacterium]
MQKTEKIKNIIFDFGGVILNIDYQRTIQAFNEIGFNDFEKAYSKASQHLLFDRLETGEISAQEFRDGIRKVTGINLNDVVIDFAWNKIILDLPEKRIRLLKELKSKYKTFLLSNTNKIHYDIYSKDLQKYGFQHFNEIFEKAYFSFELGMRKPNREIFEFVLNEQKLIPDETLFIDDSIQHIETAEKMGIITYHLSSKVDITHLFDKNYNLKILE